ncbi:Na(+)/H(+) antiporter subunit C [Saccharomonospora sp. NPDC046836]|uniref:Na(+)/H(+) antiporter subunit C n=1 Tax=Saccharomonospora sp. NPDC046836 TaxID=3156921 RepID=UPI0034075662
MTVNITMAIVLAGLYTVGLYLLMQRSLMRVILGIVIVGHGANLFLQVAGGPPGQPVFVGSAVLETMVDPLPQALALTAIVITFALTTFLLALAYRSWALLGHDEVRDDVEDRRIRLAEREREDGEESESETTTSFEAPEAGEEVPR